MITFVNRTHSKRRGQALVESSLVVIVFLSLLVGVMDFAQVLFIHQSLVDRVRSSLRWASVNPYDESSIRNMVRYYQSTQPSGTPAYLGIEDANITITRFDAGATTERISISIVDYPYNFFSPFIAKAFTNNLAVVETLPTEYRP
jgi:TadE-like protein